MPSEYSVIIPARNEEEWLPRCLEALRQAAEFASCSIEIIVVLNRCTDNTEKIALEHGCKVLKNNAKNLAIIRNAGVSEASGKIVVTVDADSIVSLNIFKKITSVMKSEKYIGGGVMMYCERYSPGIICTALFLMPIALWYGISGGLFFCKTEDFKAIGGFNEELYSVEDIDFARRLKEYGKTKGKKFKNLYSASIRTSARKFDRFGDWFFFKNIKMSLRLLRGEDREAANKVWYDFER